MWPSELKISALEDRDGSARHQFRSTSPNFVFSDKILAYKTSDGWYFGYIVEDAKDYVEVIYEDEIRKRIQRTSDEMNAIVDAKEGYRTFILMWGMKAVDATNQEKFNNFKRFIEKLEMPQDSSAVCAPSA